MTITELLANRGITLADQAKPKRVAQTRAGFDTIYRYADGPKQAEPKKQNAVGDKPRLQSLIKEDAKVSDDKAAQGGQNTQTAQTKTAQTKTAQTKPTEKSALWKRVEVQISDDGTRKLVDLDQFAQDLAAKLGVAALDVLRVLETLNLKPEDLADPKQAAAFAKELFGLSDSVELLSYPNIKDILDIIVSAGKEAQEKTVADFAKEMEAAVQTVAAAKPRETKKPEEEAVKEIVPGVEEELPETEQSVTAAAVKPQKPAAHGQAQAEAQTGTETKPETQAQTQTQTQNRAGAGREEIGAKPQTEARVFTDVNIAANQQSVQEIRHEFTVNEAVRNINTRDVVEQIVSRVRVEVKADTTEIRLTLKPESLGDVQLKISTQNGIVTAQFMAESQRVKEIIESGFSDLKDSLNRQGINVESLNVSVGQEREDANAAPQSQGGAWNASIAYEEGAAAVADISPRVDAYGEELSRGAVDYTA